MSAPRPPVNKWLVTVSITFGTLMGTIDASIINVAIPHIRGAVGATIEEITWISTGFALANVLVMPLTAFLGRLFGQKRVYMFCLALFVVGSVLCGMARSLTGLIVFRILQGLGAGALQPTEQAILRQTFPPEEQGMAMALFGMAVMIGPAVGPTLGGWIVDNYSWPWIFYINVPVGMLGLFMVQRFVHEPEDVLAANRALAEKMRGNMDWAGIALMSIGLSALQYMLEEGQRNDWFESALITACLLVAVFALAAFIIRELSAPAPAVNLGLFKDKVFLSGTLVGGVMFAMLMANTFLLPVFMQELLGFTAVQSGLALMPRTLVMILIVPFVGRMYNKVSPRLLVGFGILLVSYGSYLMSHFTLETTTSGVVTSLIVQGVGFSCLFVPLTTVALSSIPRHRMTDATGLNSLLRQGGGSIGLAVFANMLSKSAIVAKAAISTHLVAGRPEVMTRLQMAQAGLQARGVDPVTARGTSTALLAFAAMRQGMVLSFEKVFLLSAVFFVLIMPLLVFLKSPMHGQGGRKPEVHVEM
jgi:DHA2 family multidrug resistance protein